MGNIFVSKSGFKLLHNSISDLPGVFLVLHDALYLAVRGRAVAIPGSDATNPLNGAAVEPLEDLRTHDKYFQSPEGE